MVFSWLRNQRRSELLSQPFPDSWRAYLHDNVRHYNHLDPRGTMAVERLVRVFVAEKNWVGGTGINVSDEMKVTVAGQAAIMVLGVEEPYYFDDVQSIIVYLGPYRHPADRWSSPGVVHEGVAISGEAWHRGPIVLSWRDVLESGRNAAGGRNVVVHEFAHFLDGLDGEVDGTPPLAGREQERTWYRVTGAEYRRLLGQARRNEVSLLDHYGASSRAEFFAVASECFFEQPHAMHREHAELYGVLRDFYRQDPVEWLPDAEAAGRKAATKPPERKKAARQRQRKARLAALRSGDADALFTLAVEYFDEGRYLLAAAAATRALSLDPQDSEAYQQRALACIKLGRCLDALDDCEDALQCDPDDWTNYRVRGAARLELGEYDQARRDLDRVLKEDANDAEALYLRGLVWRALGDPRRAVSDLESSLAIRPLVAEVYYQNGLANRELGDLEEAEANLARAFQLDPRVDQRK